MHLMCNGAKVKLQADLAFYGELLLLEGHVVAQGVIDMQQAVPTLQFVVNRTCACGLRLLMVVRILSLLKQSGMRSSLFSRITSANSI